MNTRAIELTPLVLLGITLVLLFLDIYAFKAIWIVIRTWKKPARRVATALYWAISLLLLVVLLSFTVFQYKSLDSIQRNAFLTLFAAAILTKVVVASFMLIDDLLRGATWLKRITRSRRAPKRSAASDLQQSRSKFIAKTSLVVATAPAIILGGGIVRGGYRYELRKQRLVLPHLPTAFDGIRIIQLSDMHAGSLGDELAVRRGLELAMAQRPDILFFTGDLVNYLYQEATPFFKLLSELKAPLGIYSVLGNHDYGDYWSFPNQQAKQANLTRLIAFQEALGWKVLLNQHTYVRQGKDRLAIVGVENWGAVGHFPKYGRLDKAMKGCEAPIKLLLSHDPSHWDAEVRPKYPGIDVTFSGHTHGGQIGVSFGDYEWSPVKYLYDRWAGLYQENQQYLYVNRGFGFNGYPGRLGIMPEITEVQLNRT